MNFTCYILQSGKIQIFDLGSGTMTESVDAHEGAVWSVCMSPDKVREDQPILHYTRLNLFTSMTVSKK